MTFLERMKYKLAVTFREHCPDPNCSGHMQMYDDRPRHDYCDTCNRMSWELDKLQFEKQVRLFGDLFPNSFTRN